MTTRSQMCIFNVYVRSAQFLSFWYIRLSTSVKECEMTTFEVLWRMSEYRAFITFFWSSVRPLCKTWLTWNNRETFNLTQNSILMCLFVAEAVAAAWTLCSKMKYSRVKLLLNMQICDVLIAVVAWVPHYVKFHEWKSRGTRRPPEYAHYTRRLRRLLAPPGCRE